MPIDSGDMYDESSPSEAGAPSVKPKDEETDEQVALVPKGFFRKAPEPGMREEVEVVEVYEDECSIRCVYDKEDEETAESEAPMSPPGGQDEMMT